MKNTKLIHAYGLVVCGGKSNRMQTDKSMLTYFEKPQRYHVYEMLQPICEKVFISCNNEQASTVQTGYHFIVDEPAYQNTGPMAALLTAFDQFPEKDILFIGCDYPFLTVADLQGFANICTKEEPAAFYNQQEDIYEPLLAWYPCKLSVALKKTYRDEKYSLQQFLKNNAAVKYFPEDINSIKSIDSREDFMQAYKQINK